MPAYIISDVTIRDAEAFQTYRTRAATSIAHYGGHYLVRGGPIEKLEGDWSPQAIVIVEFPDLEQARAWYGSNMHTLSKSAIGLSAAISFWSTE